MYLSSIGAESVDTYTPDRMDEMVRNMVGGLASTCLDGESRDVPCPEALVGDFPRDLVPCDLRSRLIVSI